MNQVKFLFLCAMVFFCLLIGAYPPGVLAMSDQEKAMWAASDKANASLTFSVPTSQATAVMGEAQTLISQWAGIDNHMRPMQIETVTDNLIQTYTPTDIGELGFLVTCTVVGDEDEISVNTLYYTGNLFSVWTDRKDAEKRAHLLSFLLQRYMTTLPAQSDTGVQAAVSDDAQPALPDELESYMKLIRTQLADGQYATAISTIESLKSAVIDLQNGTTGTTPSAQAPSSTQPSSAPETTPSAPPAPVTPKPAVEAPRVYVPSTTTVAILPVVDETGAKDTNDDIAIAESALTDQFSSHGFVVIDNAKVSQAVSNLKIDLTDDEQQNRATLYRIGQSAGANLVVFVVVTDKEAKESDSGFSLIGYAKVKIWLLDDDTQEAILSAKVFDGRDGGSDTRTHYGSYLATHAVPDAIQQALKDFFKQYPVVNKPIG